MSPYELFEMICECTDKDDVVDIVNDTIDNIGQCRYTYELAQCLEEWCLNLDICPLCSGALTVIDEYEQTSECHGFPATERFTVVGCENSNCSYVV